MRLTHKISTVMMMASAVACGTTQRSVQYTEAARAIAEAEKGPGGQHAPGALESAKALLDKSKDAGPKSPEEVHYAYLARRQAQIAQADGERRTLEAEIETADETREAVLEAARKQAERRANALEARLAALKAEKDQMESRLAAVDAKLSKFVAVQSKKDRLVLTISGSVLFGFDKARLRPLAKKRLREVADVLKEQAPNKDIEVVGHTDNVGDKAYNKRLSHQRAKAVRDYLVKSGLTADNVRAVGRGETEPVASNKTSEGRANNRRVELHVLDGESDSTAAALDPTTDT